MNLRLKFTLLTCFALALTLAAGWILKTQPLNKPQMLGWGFVFTAGCIFSVRGIMLAGKLKK